jgi:hypothetical protein
MRFKICSIAVLAYIWTLLGVTFGVPTPFEDYTPEGIHYLLDQRVDGIKLKHISSKNDKTPWVGSMPISSFGTPSSNTLHFAKQGYTDVVKHYAAKDSDKRFKKPFLVACLYVPNAGYFCGSKHPSSTLDFRSTSEDAPDWYSIVRHRESFHAEDAAMYWFEKNLSSKLQPGQSYPDGSYMAVYGHFGPDTRFKRKGDMEPGEKNPCGSTGDASITPSCVDVLKPSTH